MRSASICAATPGPGRLRGHAETRRHLRTSCAIAGVASVAAVRLAAPSPALVRKERLFMGSVSLLADFVQRRVLAALAGAGGCLPPDGQTGRAGPACPPRVFEPRERGQ